MLNEDLTRQIRTKWLGKKCACFEELSSTNKVAAEMAARAREDGEDANGLLVTTETQTDGRGRKGRTWTQFPGENIAMSFVLTPDFAPDKASMVTIIAAYAVARAIGDVMIKWPNDIVITGRKVCGILTEMHMDGDRILDIVVGIGINVLTKEFPADIAATATSIALERPKLLKKYSQEIDDLGINMQPAPDVRCGLAAKVLNEFERLYEQFVMTGDLSFMKNAYNAILAGLDTRVKILDPKGEYEAISRGINKRGELIVEMGDGNRKEIYAGEVSVRGIHGYM